MGGEARHIIDRLTELVDFPSQTGNGGKFYYTNGTTGSWHEATHAVAVAMVANAGAFTIDNSGNTIVEVSGALSANGALTPTLTFPTLSLLVAFDNTTTGGFPLILAGAYTIPPGRSIWYYNGGTTSFEMIGSAQIDGSLDISLAGLSGTVTLSGSQVVTKELRFTGAPAGSVTLQFPASSAGFAWMLDNATTGGFTILAKGATATTIQLLSGAQETYYDTGTTNIEWANGTLVDGTGIGNGTILARHLSRATWSSTNWSRYGTLITNMPADWVALVNGSTGNLAVDTTGTYGNAATHIIGTLGSVWNPLLYNRWSIINSGGWFTQSIMPTSTTNTSQYKVGWTDSLSETAGWGSGVVIFFKSDGNIVLRKRVATVDTDTVLQTYSANTWYEVTMNWVGTGSGTGSVYVYINNILKATLTNSLPTAAMFYNISELTQAANQTCSWYITYTNWGNN